MSRAVTSLLLSIAVASLSGCGGGPSRPPIPAGLDHPSTTPVTVVNVPVPQTPVVLEIARPASEWTRSEAAADALKHLGPAAVPPLVAMLQDPNTGLRLKAAKVLAGLGPDAIAAVPQLRQSLHDPDPQVQKWSARALGQIGPPAATAIPDLIDALRTGDLPR